MYKILSKRKIEEQMRLSKVEYLDIEDLVKAQGKSDVYVGVEMKYCSHFGIGCQATIEDIVVPCKVISVNGSSVSQCNVTVQIDECTIGSEAAIRSSLYVLRFADHSFIKIIGIVKEYMDENNEALFIKDGYICKKEEQKVVYLLKMRYLKHEGKTINVVEETSAVFHDRESAKEFAERTMKNNSDYISYDIEDWSVL